MKISEPCVSPGLLIGQRGTDLSNSIITNDEWDQWQKPGPTDMKRDLLEQKEHCSLSASFSSLSSDNVVFIILYNFFQELLTQRLLFKNFTNSE